jgi:hypothetical protein
VQKISNAFHRYCLAEASYERATRAVAREEREAPQTPIVTIRDRSSPRHASAARKHPSVPLRGDVRRRLATLATATKGTSRTRPPRTRREGRAGR